MSTKTYFKRISLAVVVALGFGVLSGTSPANAGISSSSMSMTLSSSSASIAAGETATTSVTVQFTTSEATDSVVISSVCTLSTGETCSNNATSVTSQAKPVFYFGAFPDSNTGTIVKDAAGNTVAQNDEVDLRIYNSAAASTTRLVFNAKAGVATSGKLGTYNYSFTMTPYSSGSAVPANAVTVTWAVTVTQGNLTPASLTTYLAPTVAQAKYWKEFPGGVNASSKDSAVTKATVAADASSPAIAAYVFANALNSAGETKTALGVNICGTACSITVEVTGSGLVATSADGAAAPLASNAKKSATLLLSNSTDGLADSRELLAIYADGTPGTGTIKFYGAGRTLLATNTVTFTGTAASAVITGVTDSSVAVTNSVTLSAIMKDAAGNALNAGYFYVFTSDSKVVTAGTSGATGAVTPLSTTAAQYTQYAAGAKLPTEAHKCSNFDSTGQDFECTFKVSDTGTATIVLRDSWTVAASTWSSNEITLTGLGNTAAAFKIAFDKTSYNAGEAALITITGTDLAGRAVSNGTAGSGLTLNSVTSSLTFGNGGKTTAGTQSSGLDVTSATFKGYTLRTVESGIETRAVVMPSTSGTLTYTIKYTPANSTTETTASASVTIVDPAEVAANAATAAAKAAQAAAVEAADAATDAALQAIDAANAATDAANLAAEAADAATVAAEEAKDAADAATAAVEALATQVATLMAALQAQIRSLANTVAKIAKKVKA